MLSKHMQWLIKAVTHSASSALLEKLGVSFVIFNNKVYYLPLNNTITTDNGFVTLNSEMNLK